MHTDGAFSSGPGNSLHCGLESRQLRWLRFFNFANAMIA
jgi:hypothetical protein